MNTFLKNQRNAFMVLVGGFLVSLTLWYFVFHQSVQSSYNKSKDQHTKISRERSQYRGMKNGLPAIEQEWKSLNMAFENVLEKIPYKRSYDHVSNTLYELFLKKGLEIQDYVPSDVPIEKKTIVIPDSDEKLTIEKYPIDVELVGNYIQLGQFLETLKSMPYRITASNIQIKKGKSKSNQNIKLIAYVYLQSGNKNPKVAKSKPVKATKPKPAVKEKKRIRKPIQKDSAKPMVAKETEKPAPPKKKEKTEKPIQSDFVLKEALICEEIDLETKLPILPGTSFSTSIGRLYCFSFITNQSGNPSMVSHHWYLNNELMSKSQIHLKRDGKTKAISNVDFNQDKKGQWKVVIIDQDKNVLETIFFELV